MIIPLWIQGLLFLIGDGKTHYIKKQLHSPYLIIAVNESFTFLSVISKLRKLPVDKRCAVFFNFTIIPLPVSLHAQYVNMFCCKLRVYTFKSNGFVCLTHPS